MSDVLVADERARTGHRATGRARQRAATAQQRAQATLHQPAEDALLEWSVEQVVGALEQCVAGAHWNANGAAAAGQPGLRQCRGQEEDREPDEPEKQLHAEIARGDRDLQLDDVAPLETELPTVVGQLGSAPDVPGLVTRYQ